MPSRPQEQDLLSTDIPDIFCCCQHSALAFDDDYICDFRIHRSHPPAGYLDQVIISMVQIKDTVNGFVYHQVGTRVSGKESRGTSDNDDRPRRSDCVQFERHLPQGNTPVIHFVTRRSPSGTAYQRVVIDVFVWIESYAGIDSGQGQSRDDQYTDPALA